MNVAWIAGVLAPKMPADSLGRVTTAFLIVKQLDSYSLSGDGEEQHRRCQQQRRRLEYGAEQLGLR